MNRYEEITVKLYWNNKINLLNKLFLSIGVLQIFYSTGKESSLKIYFIGINNNICCMISMILSMVMYGMYDYVWGKIRNAVNMRSVGHKLYKNNG